MTYTLTVHPAPPNTKHGACACGVFIITVGGKNLLMFYQESACLAEENKTTPKEQYHILRNLFVFL